MGQFAIGQAVPRTEDPRLLTGGGNYLDDMNLARQLYAYFLRAPHAHARITGIDAAAAKAAPGVHAVFTGADWRAGGLGFYRSIVERQRRDGSPMFFPPRPALADGRVMHVGDAVALVIADTAYQALDASELIAVAYEVLPALTDTARVLDEDAPRVWPDNPDNECFLFAVGDKAAVDKAFAGAAHVVSQKFVINRISANTMEPRGCIADYDPGEERYTLYTGVQRPHDLRRQMASELLGVPENKVRVASGDVGGSFGMKGGTFPEYAALVWASKEVGRPVKWVCGRGEGLASDDHDRDHVSNAELALDGNGRFLALRVANVSNIGAYLGSTGVVTPTFHLGGLAGTYTTPHIYAEASAAFTNTSSTGPFRGSGRPEASYIVERLIDNAARSLGIDRAAIRRINTVPAAAMPFKTGLVYTLDCGEFLQNLDQALATADYETFEARRAEARDRGMLRGIGIANIIEQTSQIFGETVEIRFNPGGGVTVFAGSISHGQGHETMYKIILSDLLGLDGDDIGFVQADTDRVADGGGTFASRTAALGGSAAKLAADKIIAKGKIIAAHMLEAAAGDIAFDNGAFTVAGTDKSVSLTHVAKTAYAPQSLPPDIEPGLAELATFAPEIPNFPNGCHVCEVEIDPETGATRLNRYSVVDDVGTVINLMTLEGQIHGGIGQAVGQALIERIVYDPDTGQLLTGSFLDYAMPRADEMCRFDLANNPVPTATNPLGAKGAGEAGNVGALPAIMNAVVDALAPLGITHIDMPATSERVWRAIQDAEDA